MYERQYATPSGHDVHLDVPLSNLAISAFSDGTTEFIADQVFPAVPVAKQFDKYYIIEKGAFLRAGGNDDGLRAPKTKARKIEYEVSSDNYYAPNYAFANENALEDLANADTAIALRENSVRLITTRLRRQQEVRVANLCTSIDNVGSGVQLSGANSAQAFSNPASNDPIAVVNTGHAFIRSQTGLVANTMIIDWDSLQNVKRSDKLIEVYKHTNTGEVDDAFLMSAFKVQRMLVGMGIKENALEGGTSSMTNIWGNHLILAHLGPATGMQSMVPGLRFTWTPPGFQTAFQAGRQVFSGAGTNNVEVVEAGHFQDEKIVARDLMYTIQTEA